MKIAELENLNWNSTVLNFLSIVAFGCIFVPIIGLLLVLLVSLL